MKWLASVADEDQPIKNAGKRVASEVSASSITEREANLCETSKEQCAEGARG
jgi:hypothetical protein